MILQTLINQAWELKKTGDRAGALKLYGEAFDILADEASAHAHSQSGTILDEMTANGEKVRTITPKLFDETKKYFKQDKVACTISNNIAVIYAELGNKEYAKNFFEQAIELTPDEVEYNDPKIGLEVLNN